MPSSAMRPADLDRLLAALVVALAATGLVSLRAGAPSTGWLFVVHGLLAGALGIATVLKLARSVPGAAARGRWARLAIAAPVSLLVVAALAGGWLWVASGRLLWVDAGILGRWTVLTLHAWAGLVLLPFLAIHLLPRRWRLLRPRPAGVATADTRRLDRRAVVTGGLLAVGALGLTAVVAGADRLLGGIRRFTGSRWLPAGGVPPPTTFFGEPAPPLDLSAWRLRISEGSGTVVELDLETLRSLGEVERRAVLDCTSGWAIETGWRGVPLRRVLESAGLSIEPGARHGIVVRSVTGWAATVPVAEVDAALLAWSVAGEALPAANGAPLRLVLPDHRGLDWVKWVASIEVG